MIYSAADNQHMMTWKNRSTRITIFDSRVLFTMHRASCKDRSISSSMKSFAPLSIIETYTIENHQALCNYLQIKFVPPIANLLKIGMEKVQTALVFFMPFTRITSSSAILSSTTSSACPRNDESNVSSPSMSANVLTWKVQLLSHQKS